MTQPVMKSGRTRPGSGITLGAAPPPEAQSAVPAGLVDPGLHAGSAPQAQILLGQSRAKAQALIDEAEAQAGRTLEAARSEAARIIAEAQQAMDVERQGLEQRVRAEIEPACEERLKASTEAFAAAARQMNARAGEYLESLREPALELILAISRRLVRAQWESGVEALGRLSADALTSRQSRELARLEVSPQVLAQLGDRGALDAALLGEGIAPERIVLSADPALSASQFRLRLATSLVEFDLERALRELESLVRSMALSPATGDESAEAVEAGE
jgi:cell division septum initiation protein DivIVA